MIKKIGLLTLIFSMLIGLFFALPVKADDEYMTCVVDEGTGQVLCDGKVTTMSESDLTQYESTGYGSYKVPKEGSGVQFYNDNSNDGTYVNSDGSVKCTIKAGIVRACYKRGENGTWMITEKSAYKKNMQKTTGSPYVQDGGGALYYALTGEIDDLWNFDIKRDIAEPIAWLSERASYIVIKSIGDDHQVFWNVPNVQQSAVNAVLSLLPDGFRGGTYDVEDTEKLVPVGSHAAKTNLMSKLGFYIPSYNYAGEFPVVYLSLNRVIPTSVWKAAWKVIRAVISGESFIDAPDAQTYNSMRYLGYDYTYPEENIIIFIEKYWQEYFVNKLYSSKDTFRSFYNVSASYMTSNAKHIKTSHKDSKSTSSELAVAGTISEEYVSYDALQSSKTYIAEHYPRRYLVDGDSVKAVYIVSDEGNYHYGKINDENLKFSSKLSDDDIHVEDVTDVLTPQIKEVVEDDRWAAVGTTCDDDGHCKTDYSYDSIARNRCEIESINKRDVTDGRDGLDEWWPEYYENDYWWTYYWTTSEYDGPAECTNCTTDGPYLPFSDRNYTCSGDAYPVGSSCYIDVQHSERRFDSAAYDNDKHYWKTGEGSPATKIGDEERTPYKGAGQLIDNVPKCMDQYINLYDRCVEGEFKDDDKRSICAIKKNGKYGSQSYSTYTPSVGEFNEYGQYDGREGSTSHGYGWSYDIYEFYKMPNFGSRGDEILFCHSGREGFYYFDKEIKYTDEAKERRFPMDDIIDTVGIDIHSTDTGYNQKKKIVADYRDFMERLQKSLQASKKDKTHIYYNQCLITSMNTGKCEASDGSQLSIYNVYAQSQLYKILMDDELIAKEPQYAGMDIDEIKRQNAEKIVEKIQSTSGQYYSEVMDNIIQIMIQSAKESGHEIQLEDYVSKRVLPYDIDNMVTDNAELVGIPDPRFNRSLVSKLAGLDMTELATSTIKRDFAERILGIVGGLSELCVILVQWMNFDFLEARGLSPATMWTSNLMQLLIGLLVIYFIIQLLNIAKKFINGRAGIAELASRVISFLLIFGVLTVMSVDPLGVWSTMKNAMSKIMYLGETQLLGQNEAYKSFLNGENDPEVIYWTPYFDAWSLYNTGYGILDSEQRINRGDGTPEVSETDSHSHSIPDDVQLWSVLLAKSFVHNDENNRTSINNNAYRVVDHFMAPRVDATDTSISVTENENYNGQFQTSIIRVFPKILSTALILAIVCVKFLVFLYLWYMLYLLVFNIILSLSIKDNKDLKELLKKTFIPVLQLMVIGLWSSLVIYVSARLNDVVGLTITLALWYISITIFISWKQRLGNFPPTLDWLYTVIELIGVKGKQLVSKLKKTGGVI